MKRSMTQRGMAVVLTAALLAPTSAFGASASDFSDFPSDWSTQALSNAVDNGLLGGYGGKIDAKGTLTRAQMAAIINRAFGSTAEASLDDVTDVGANSWYRDDMAKALQMGTFVGVGDGKLNPDAAITRQEALAVLARAFAIDDADADALSKFSDADDVSGWARQTVAAMVQAGYINGYEDGTLNPKGTITRAEFAAVMDNMVKTYVSQSADGDKVAKGNVLVRAGTDLSGMTIEGDLILADGIGTDDVNLDGVTVTGRIIIRGGDSDSIKLTKVKAASVVVANPNTAAGIVVKDSDLGTVTAKTDLVVDGDVAAVTVRDGASVSVKNGTVGSVTVDKDSANSTVSVDKGATVTTVEANGENVKVSGEGKVSTVKANADGAAITVPSAKVEVADGAQNVTAGGVSVEAGKDVTVNSKGDGIVNGSTGGGGSSSGGGGGNVTPDPEPEKDPMTDAQKQSLNELIAKAQKLVDADASLTDLAAAIKDAQALVDNKDATADAATAMITRLEKAIDTVPEKPSQEPVSATSKAVSVGSYGYTVQATVTIDPNKNNAITKIEWTNSEPGASASFVTTFKNGESTFLDKFLGLDADNAESTMSGLKLEPSGYPATPSEANSDAVSGATYTSSALRDAIADAYAKAVAQAQPTRTATSKNVAVGSYGYTMQATVTVDKSKNNAITDISLINSEPGSSASFLTTFKNGEKTFLDKFLGLNADNAESTMNGLKLEPSGFPAVASEANKDAVSGATYTSVAARDAIADAYKKASSDTVAPDAPTVSTPDRTDPMYAATGDATLSVSAAEGATVLYTTDGSDPATEAGGATKALEGNELKVAPGENTTHETTVKLIAVADGQASDVTSETVQFIKIPDADKGTKVYVGSVQRAGYGGTVYDIKMRVTTVDGVIRLVEDEGTEEGIDPDSYNYNYWVMYDVMNPDYGMPSYFYGKTLEEVLNMKTVPEPTDAALNADAVSGATIWSNAIRYGVIAALQNEPEEGEGTIKPVTLSSEEPCSSNDEGDMIRVVMKSSTGNTIRYTTDGTDPTADSTEAQKIDYDGNLGVNLKADPENYPDGRVIEVRAAAFDSEGNRSAIATGYYTFASPNPSVSYKMDTYTATVDGVTANVTISTPHYDGYYYITNITLGDSKPYETFLPELLSRVFLAQTTDGVEAISGHEADSAKILAAIQAALDQGVTAIKPQITVTPDKGQYANDEEVTVKITTPTKDAKIYYSVDYDSIHQGSMLTDPTTDGTPYEGEFKVKAKDLDGETVFIQAAATTDPAPEGDAEDTRKWSATTRLDLTFMKAVADGAISVNGTPVASWDAAVEAINNSADGGTITLDADVEIPQDAQLPTKPCTITSKGDTKRSITGTTVHANADLTFDDVEIAFNRLYANGHDVTMNDNVETAWSFSGSKGIYAGGDGVDTTAADGQTITVKGGEFEIVTSGTANTTFNGDVTVNASDSAEVEIVGVALSATANGDRTYTIDGSSGNVSFGEFTALQSQAKLDGNLTLTIIGAPKLATWKPTYQGTANSTLDLSGADASITADTFTGFTTVVDGR
ncbi:MAG: S-layer homology domain-containing protein [Peptococcaceae bacterium]|nr:S-layer homology domain-containing protein [Peptococcaceae bacterium]